MTPFALRRARDRLHAGGLVAYPTEAVYGLGCDPENGAAVRRLLALKRRPMDKGLILIGAEFAQLAPYLAIAERDLPAAVRASWPGAVTWLLPAHPAVSEWLRGRHSTLAVRVTAHVGAAALCRVFGGAVVSTSANPAGRRPARDALTVRRYFGAGVDGVLHGALGGRGRPSEIRDAASGRVVRGG